MSERVPSRPKFHHNVLCRARLELPAKTDTDTDTQTDIQTDTHTALLAFTSLFTSLCLSQTITWPKVYFEKLFGNTKKHPSAHTQPQLLQL